MTNVAISVHDLTKTYTGGQDVHALRGLSFEVAPGEVYGLLGHNGAGKTTTVEILEGHRQATSGTVSVLGMDPAHGGREFRDQIGIVLQSSEVERFLTVREALTAYGSVYSRRRGTDDVIEMVGLTDKADARVGTLSGGQRRRLDLALGIVGTPGVLFLDEPTTGFDPAARRQAWQLIKHLCDGGTTVLLTTHYLDEAEYLADRVGVMVDGRLVAEGTPDQLMDAAPAAQIEFVLPAGLAPKDFDVPTDAEVIGDRVVITTDKPTPIVAAITAAAEAHGVELTGLSVRRPSLEDVFLRLGQTHGDDHGEEPSGDDA